jgi:hypothetical protein
MWDGTLLMSLFGHPYDQTSLATKYPVAGDRVYPARGRDRERYLYSLSSQSSQYRQVGTCEPIALASDRHLVNMDGP